MKISERFGLNATQYELDFVDVDTEVDIPLFLDPYFIGKCGFPFASEAHLSLKSFFNCLLSALNEKRINDARSLFSYLGESNEICLGFSSSKPQGKGMGPSDAKNIFLGLKGSKALETGLMEDIEDIRIFVDNVDKDKVSDMTSNIIKKQLIEYTQSQCRLWDIPLQQSVSSGFYWDRESNSWDNQYTEMLLIDGKRILLVPKRIVSFSKEYTPQKYLQHFVLNFLQDEQLRINGPLVQYRKDKGKTPYVTKKSILEDNSNANAINKSWLADFTSKHREVFDKFRSKTIDAIHPIENFNMSTIDLPNLCQLLIQRLNEIPMGNEAATDYHHTIVGIMELLFYPDLCFPIVEQEIHDGRKRIDIVFDNCAKGGFFNRLGFLYGMHSPFIIVECKNYSRDVKNPELDQIAGRFSPQKGKVGIVACRTIDDMDTLVLRCSDAYRDNRGLIIPLVDKDFIEMLRALKVGKKQAIDDILQHRFPDIGMR